MDDGILIISEDDLDNFFQELPMQHTLQHNLQHGTNLLLGCYGLLLIAKDQSDDPIIQLALDQLYTIQPCTMFNIMAIYFPMNDLSLQGIQKLARAIVVIANVSQGKLAEDIPMATGIIMEHAMLLSLRIKMVTTEQLENIECQIIQQKNS